jgi:hypothetical protein
MLIVMGVTAFDQRWDDGSSFYEHFVIVQSARASVFETRHPF